MLFTFFFSYRIFVFLSFLPTTPFKTLRVCSHVHVRNTFSDLNYNSECSLIIFFLTSILNEDQIIVYTSLPLQRDQNIWGWFGGSGVSCFQLHVGWDRHTISSPAIQSLVLILRAVGLFPMSQAVSQVPS